jgi:putative YphP/YqiW family bacilliredoxin
MMYDERMVAPMRQELTRLGVEELRSAADVDAKLKALTGTALVVVNSVCGCAARNARPAVAAALAHATKPNHLFTVFAGQDREANLVLLEDLCELMVDGSLCAMGGLTPMPVRSVLLHFPEDLRRPS